MTDLHALLHDYWCRHCNAPAGESCKHLSDMDGKPRAVPPLSERMPEAVPAGLKVHESDGSWWIRDPDEGMPLYRRIANEQAKWMCIGKWMEVLDIGSDIVVAGKGELVQRLAATMHELADFRDAAKETE